VYRSTSTYIQELKNFYLGHQLPLTNIGNIYKNFFHHHKNTPNDTPCIVWCTSVMMRKILANAANITHLQPLSQPIHYNCLSVSVTNHKIILPHDPEDCKNNFHCCELQISSHVLRYYKYICCKICSNSLVHFIYLTMKQYTTITHSFTPSSLSASEASGIVTFPNMAHKQNSYTTKFTNLSLPSDCILSVICWLEF